MSKIVVEKSGKVEQEHPLVDGQVYQIGRDKDNDIVLLSPRVSRRHARIEVIGGRYRIVDLESGNGLNYRGKRVPDLMLSPGAVIDIGDFTLRFELTADEKAAAETRPKLVLIGGREQAVYALGPKETTIGRSSSSDVQVDSTLASSNHCKIIERGSVYALLDQGSENGTYVDGLRVREKVLKQGSQIRIAELTFYFAADGEVPEEGSIELIHPVQSAKAPPAGTPLPTVPPPAPAATAATSDAPRMPERRPAAAARTSGVPKVALLGAAGALLLLLLAALLLLRSPDASTEREFQEVFQASLTAEERERIEQYLADADRYAEDGNVQLALEQYQKIIVLDPTHQDALAQQALLEERLDLQQEERQAREREELERIAEVGELMEQADEHVRQRQYAQARSVLEKAAALAPESDLLRSKQAETYVAEGDALSRRDTARARSAYRKALELDSANRAARRGVARIDQSRRSAEEQSARVEALNEKGLAELNREDFRAAQQTFSEVLELDPEDGRAAEFREQARALLEEKVRPIYEEGVRLYNAGELSAAMGRFQRALELDPEHPDTRSFLTRAMERVRGEAVDRYKRAYIYEGLGRLDEALVLYEEALALLPDPREEYHQKSAERVEALRRKLP